VVYGRRGDGSLLCEHSELFSETWPTSGMTRLVRPTSCRRRSPARTVPRLRRCLPRRRCRWEHTLGRPAPAPTQTSSKGNPQLAPAFVEWMMGLPAGWVTDTPGITRNEALKALGNGVVPLQAEAALRLLLDVLAAVA
jgi:hypothetical protein